MLAEVLKKKGRPKKVVLGSIVEESMQPVKKGSVWQKSPKTSSQLLATTFNRPAGSSTATSMGTTITSTAGRRGLSGPKPPTVPTRTPVTSQMTPAEVSQQPLAVPTGSNKSSPPKVMTVDSKIPNQVRALSLKTPSIGNPPTAILKALNPTSGSPILTSITSSKYTGSSFQINKTESSIQPALPIKSSSPSTEWEPQVSSQANRLKASLLQPPSIPANAPAQFQKSSKSIPITGLNSSIVSQISSRPGARPGRPPTELPANYKQVARKITFAIVALPIAIVTSWVLFERLVLGEEHKHIVRPGITVVEKSPSTGGVLNN